ncbi:primosomal protein N' [Thioalkalivibrio sulfidiphilus HL-EbGr7]|uniref:Replication restart protein PriA n=1 Tax=Thioalkalivibrio sulfidiphilus (strain HL-EbGR7) TaxID=396588 RepID=B8GU91_THISH|nr:primosomal protein N' [Thioalkalivibrio sulfidiphilus]ACL71374.1 primosomal protein N' [Thioalkalivibrio sulfidiphilus HL-EbGr7]
MKSESPIAICRVAVPGPLPEALDYRVPERGEPPVPGARVRVDLGRRQVVGVVTALASTSEIPRNRLRPVREVLDEASLLDDTLMALLTWAADYYHHPVGEVLNQALPVLLRQGREAQAATRSVYRLSDAGAQVDPATLTRAPRQSALLALLREAPGGLSAGELEDEPPGNWGGVLRAVVERGWVERIERALDAIDGPCPARAGPALNEAQAAAVEAVRGHFGQFAPHLLQGVTGSGKTEVYLQLIEAALAEGRQTLVLVPEIALTPQLVRRFRSRLACPVAVLHSGLGERERLDGWLAARSGAAGVIIGTRSAVFVPWARPGLIIVDEEHDGSFKQHEGFRYHARDVAVKRAHLESVPVLLGSATPSFESLANVTRGQYTRLRLRERAGGAAPPRVELLDLRRQTLDEGLSLGLMDRMQRHLEAEGQVLLFLNRRGFAPTLLCHDCGWVAECPRCDARMTWHQGDGRIRCHHCGHERNRPRHCPACGSVSLGGLGQGTERVEAALERHFPGHSVARLDRDSTRRKGALEAVLEDVRSGRHRILVGTQMLAKGHHFPDVTLVGILDADQGLFSADFRAAERMAQMMVQVAGRAGRAGRAGEVVIQTHHPDHPLLLTLVHQGYEAFAEAALAERRVAGLPPYTSLVLLRAEATGQQAPNDFLEAARRSLEALRPDSVQIWGPAPALMERRAGRYRAQLMIQSASRPALQRALRAWTPGLAQLPGARKVRWVLDVDALEM